MAHSGPKEKTVTLMSSVTRIAPIAVRAERREIGLLILYR
jgi:hypothetical protein